MAGYEFDDLSTANTSPLNIRLPKGLKAELDEAVRMSHRSLNGEIVFRLRQSIETEKTNVATVESLKRVVNRMDDRMSDVLAALTKLLVKS